MSAQPEPHSHGTVAVTGSTGFLGRALVDRLVHSGIPVRAAVRGAGTRLPAPVTSVPGCDLGVCRDWTPLVQGADAVVHCAARAHLLDDRADDPLAEFRRVNVDGTLALATQAAAAGVRSFVFVSSIGVNGGQTFGTPFTPTDAPAPHSAYAVSKLEAEEGLRSLARSTGMQLVVIRPPLITGPGAPGNLARLLKLIDSGWPLPLGGLRHNRRSLVSRENLVDLIVHCLENTAAAGEVLLVRDGDDISTTELVRRLAQARGRPARLVPVPPALVTALAAAAGRRSTAVQLCGSLQVDDSRTRALLGWAPPLTLAEGLVKAAMPATPS